MNSHDKGCEEYDDEEEGLSNQWSIRKIPRTPAWDLPATHILYHHHDEEDDGDDDEDEFHDDEEEVQDLGHLK